ARPTGRPTGRDRAGAVSPCPPSKVASEAMDQPVDALPRAPTQVERQREQHELEVPRRLDRFGDDRAARGTRAVLPHRVRAPEPAAVLAPGHGSPRGERRARPGARNPTRYVVVDDPGDLAAHRDESLEVDACGDPQ